MAQPIDIETSFLENSQAAMLAAIEIHNKPVMAYRYSICVLLAINAWELLLKAFISGRMPHLKLVEDSGYFMPFEKCLANVQNEIGMPFSASRDNLNALYEWRNKVAHYNCAPLDEVVYSLLRANVLFFSDFLREHFDTTLAAPDNFVLLPLGFSPSLGPLQIICEKSHDQSLPQEAQNFLQNITHSIRSLHEQGVEDAILAEYNVHLVNASRAKNADLIAKIDNQNPDAATLYVERSISDFRLSNSPDAPEVRLPTYNERFKNFKITHRELLLHARERYSDFKQDQIFRGYYKEWKKDPNCCQMSFLDPIRKSGMCKPMFGGRIWDEMDKHYTIRSSEAELEINHS